MYIGLLQIDTQTDTNTCKAALQLKESVYVKIKSKIIYRHVFDSQKNRVLRIINRMKVKVMSSKTYPSFILIKLLITANEYMLDSGEQHQ